MPRGFRRPNGAGRVDRGTFFKPPKPMTAQEEVGFYPRIDSKTGNRVMGPEDEAPAGGIPRPAMEGCASCGTPTPKGSGTCADCK